MSKHDHHMPHASEAYRIAYDAAQPDVGRAVIAVDLEAKEFDWTIAPGATFRSWGFNGQVPGPTIESQVGDVLEVRLTNHLPEPTVVHWHGLRIPAAMDGTEMVQPTDRVGRHLRLSVHAPPDAGTFWYHSHWQPLPFAHLWSKQVPFLFPGIENRTHRIQRSF